MISPAMLIEKFNTLEGPEQIPPFLDWCEEQGIEIPGRDVIPEKYLYQASTIRYLLALMQIATELRLKASVETGGQLDVWIKYKFAKANSYIASWCDLSGLNDQSYLAERISVAYIDAAWFKNKHKGILENSKR